MRKLTIVSLGWLLVASAGQAQAASTNAELRGIWMHATQIKTPAETEQAVARVAARSFSQKWLLLLFLVPRINGLR
jgi:hypothetical protein